MAKFTVEQALARAQAHLRKGETAKAREIYLAVLRNVPGNNRARAALGAIEAKAGATGAGGQPPRAALAELVQLHDSGQVKALAQRLPALLKAYPASFVLWNIEGIVRKTLGQTDRAAAAFRRVTELNPGFPDGFNNLGVTQQEAGEFEAAVSSYRKALDRRPDYAEAHGNLGNALKELGRFGEAVESYRRALTLKPDYADGHYNLGNALTALGQPGAAEASYRAALKLRPDFADAHNNLGVTLRALDRPDAAAEAFARAVAIRPDYAEAHNNLGLALKDRGQLEAAVTSYRRAVELRPDYAEAHNNLGIALRELGRFDDAVTSHERALALRPDYADALHGLGNTLKEQGALDAALAAYGAELETAAVHTGAEAGLLEECKRLLAIETMPAIYASEDELGATRTRIETMLEELARKLRQDSALGTGSTEFLRKVAAKANGFYLAYHQEDDRPLMENLSFILGRFLNLPTAEIEPAPPTGRPIRLGIASQRLRDHNGANWAYNWLSKLPREDYAFFTYNFEFKSDALARKFAGLGTHRTLKFDVANAEAIAAMMRADELDLLMLPDVGMTVPSRVLSLCRIAPRQFTAWGHPVTTGSPQMDDFLSSDLMEPPEAQAHYSETLRRMPNLALFLEEGPPPPPAGSFALPEGRVCYGCLQSLYKYLPRYDEIFPRIAQEVPKALFVFLEGFPAYMTPILKARLERAFAAFGLDAARHVAILPRQSSEDFVRLTRRMDVLVDSIGWSGGNTSLTAIDCEVPLVTLPGRFMRGRHTDAMLRMIGAEEMSARSVEDLIGKLVRLGRDRDYRSHCARLLGAHKPALYEDWSFVAAFDAYLKRGGA